MLLTAIAIAAIHQTAQAPTRPPVAAPAPVLTTPAFPMGARPELHQLLHLIQDTLGKGDTAGAARLADNLPKPNFTLGWDESSLPENLRPAVDEMRDLVVKAWEHIPNVHITVAAHGDVDISFAKELPKDAAGLPEASQLTFGTNPRIKAVIGLTRGNPSQSIIPNDAYMEIGHAIGAFLGNADDSLPGSCMYRNNLPALRVYGPNKGNWFVAGHDLAASDAVRALIKDHKPLAIDDSKVGVTPDNVAMGIVKQGLQIPLDFTVVNTGKATLVYNLVPDCGCFTRIPAGAVAPGQKTTLRTLVNTAHYVGEIHKMLVLYSNDPEIPVKEIPVTFTATPPYRLYRAEGENVILPIANNTIDVLMTVPAGSKIKPNQFDWSGAHDKVTMEPWTGTAPDPDMNEPAKPRQGYVFHIKLADKQIDGRTSGTLHIVTDDEGVPELTYTVYIQKGIVASPSEVFLGEMTTVTRGTFLISRRGKPFKITGVELGTKSLKATITPIPDGSEYRIDLIYDGSASKGDFVAQIKVKTDDPAQPALDITVRGTVL